VKQAADQAERLRTFAGILKANADGAQLQRRALNDNVKALQQYHLSADEAVAITRTVRQGRPEPELFREIRNRREGHEPRPRHRCQGRGAAGRAGFHGRLRRHRQARRRDQFPHRLRARAHPHAVRQRPRSRGAPEAFDKFQKSQHDAAEEMRGPWTQAIEHLDTAWEHRFKESLADSGWANALKEWPRTASQAGSTASPMRSTASIRADASTPRSNNASSPSSCPTPTPATPQQEARAVKGGSTAQGSRVIRAQQQQADQKAVDDARTEIDLQRQLQNATSDTAKAALLASRPIARDRENRQQGCRQLKRQAAEEQTLTQIQMERRKGLLSSAEQFLGKRENNREDAAVLRACSTSTASRLRRAARRPAKLAGAPPS
jgi:hypothetical protein